MNITVLVPDELGVAALADVAGVRAVRYSPGEPWPVEAAEASVLVPAFLSTFDVTALVRELPKLAYVQLLTAGAEHWIGRLPADVRLATCQGAHGGSTAEWVVAALLSIYRELDVFESARQARRWQHHATDTLQGKRVLVIGAGDVAAALVSRLVPFDTQVTLVGRTARDGVRGVAELPDLLGDYDAVVLTVPLTTATTGLVDARFLASMADGSVLVNAARGRVVDTDALVAELRSGRLRAALDVTEPEPLPADHPLWNAPGLLLTPHVGGSVRGSSERSWRVAALEIARYAAGEEPRNLVSGEY